MHRTPFLSRSRRQSFAALATALVLAAGPAYAVKNTGGEYNTLHAGLGAEGFDVVAYFTDSRAVPGSEAYTVQYGGVTWQFASKVHRDLFADNPSKYAPQYGGFCAWGVANGKLFDVDPVNGWTVHQDRLYLNFNAEINDTFAANAGKLIRDADRHWPGLNR